MSPTHTHMQAPRATTAIPIDDWLGAEVLRHLQLGRGDRRGKIGDRNRSRKRDGVSASKNWKTMVFLIPPEWNEYIPKKNRHSESVRPGGHRRYLKGVCGGTSPAGGKGCPRPAKQNHPDLEAENKTKKRTAPSVPKWSPTSVLTGPDQA